MRATFWCREERSRLLGLCAGCAAVPYPEDAKPLFVRHYWLKGSRPELLRRSIACVDWSVAKAGFLCAYRWDGEREMDGGKFVWTD